MPHASGGWWGYHTDDDRRRGETAADHRPVRRCVARHDGRIGAGRIRPSVPAHRQPDSSLRAGRDDVIHVEGTGNGNEVTALDRHDEGLIQARLVEIVLDRLSVEALQFRPVIIQLREPSPANPDRLPGLKGECPGVIGFAHCLDRGVDLEQVFAAAPQMYDYVSGMPTRTPEVIVVMRAD